MEKRSKVAIALLVFNLLSLIGTTTMGVLAGWYHYSNPEMSKTFLHIGIGGAIVCSIITTSVINRTAE